MTKTDEFVKLEFISVIMDANENEQILHREKLFPSCSKLLLCMENLSNKRTAQVSVIDYKPQFCQSCSYKKSCFSNISY